MRLEATTLEARERGHSPAYQNVNHHFAGATRSPWVDIATIPQRRQTQTWTIPPKSVVVVEGRDLIRSTWLHLLQAGALMSSPHPGSPRTSP